MTRLRTRAGDPALRWLSFRVALHSTIPYTTRGRRAIIIDRMKRKSGPEKKASPTGLANQGYVVGIGASAGGLEALIAFFKQFPKNIPLAFVLIQHLEPRHKSALVEILSRATALDVCEAGDNAALRPSRVYTIPPNTLMAVKRGRLRITERVRRADGSYLPVDHFLTSLAGDRGARAIGVILSGTGTDGTLGAQAIKAQGGLVFAQDEKTARYFGMPGSARMSGAVDYVLEPGAIAARLIRLSRQGFLPRARRPGGSSLPEADGLAPVLASLRELTGVDFNHYKKTTVSRRVNRRMAGHRFASYGQYGDYLRQNPAEAEALLKDILIPVTSFFRDSDVFTALRNKAFPLIVGKRKGGTPLRVWVPACSTGEEAYSLAIALYQFMEKRRAKPLLQVFGTDLSEALIARARAGVFPASIADRVPAAWLRRFFRKTAEGYVIAKAIRDLCVFAKHDLTGDPPLSNMDLVSCRNLLIYLDEPLQNRALSLLHYALKPSGVLVLGTAESPSAAPDLFSPVDKKYKIFSRNETARKSLFGTLVPGAPAVTVGRRKAGQSKAPVPADRPSQKAPSRRKKAAAAAPAAGAAGSVARLKQEFLRTVERLNAVSREKDVYTEELKVANEAIQSSNEELQSLNEELETSKEELQSTNEELQTLNDELQEKNSALTNLNGDLSNFFASSNIPLIIVGNDLRIKRFTPTARKVMNLILSDVGRPLGDIKTNVGITDLEERVRRVGEDMVPYEAEVRDGDGHWYSLRIRPYRTLENKIEGAVIALFDIDAIKKSRDEAQAALEYTRAVFETIREPLLVLDRNARVVSANRSFYAMFKLRAADVEKKSLYVIGGGEWNDPALRKLLVNILPKKSHFDHFELSAEFAGLGPRVLILNGRQVKAAGRESPLILLAIEDVTRRKKADELLKRDARALEKLVRERSSELLDLRLSLERSKHLSDIGTLAATVAHELRNVLSAVQVAVFNIRRKTSDSRVESSLAGIDRVLVEGEQIINNVLSYSKIQVSRFEPVKINEILELLIDETKDRAGKLGITLRVNIASTKGLVIEADPVKIKEVFSNIINNAFDAVSRDTGIVRIESGSTAAVLTVACRDNGAGISVENQVRAFDPFFTTKAKGTGLGLAVCRQILLLHDGAIVLECGKRRGTEVRVTLPRRRNVHA